MPWPAFRVKSPAFQAVHLAAVWTHVRSGFGSHAHIRKRPWPVLFSDPRLWLGAGGAVPQRLLLCLGKRDRARTAVCGQSWPVTRAVSAASLPLVLVGCFHAAPVAPAGLLGSGWRVALVGSSPGRIHVWSVLTAGPGCAVLSACPVLTALPAGSRGCPVFRPCASLAGSHHAPAAPSRPRCVLCCLSSLLGSRCSSDWRCRQGPGFSCVR